MQVTTNGHAPAVHDTPSGALRHITAQMDSYAIWQDLSDDERLQMILTRYPVDEWFLNDRYTTDNLSTLAHFWPDAAQRGRIKAVCKQLGGSPWDLEQAVEAVRASRSGQPQAPSTTPAATQPQAALTTLADVQARPVEWLWWPYLAKGTIAMLDGDPGLGKSLLALQLAACLSRGYPLPDQEGKPTLPTGSPQHVLLLTSEDSPEHTIKPRLLQAGGDPRYVHILHGWTDPNAEDPTEVQAFTLKDVPILEQALERFPAALVVIDPLQGVMGGIDMHRSNETRPLLSKLAALARKHEAVILCIRHPAKAGEGMGKALHRGLGSVDIIGIARTALFVEGYPGDETRAFLAQTKSNLGKKGRTLIFSKKEGVFAWEGVTRLSDEDLAGSGRGPNHRAYLEALLWLEHRLEDGLAWNASDIESEADVHDLATTTLRRAKKALGVVSAKGHDKDAPWTWRLPRLPLSVPPSSTTSSTSVTSTTSTSLDKSKSCEDGCAEGARQGEGGEGGEGVEGVEDVEVSQVPRGEAVAPLMDPVPPAPATSNGQGSPNGQAGATAPPATCYRCHGTVFWSNAGGQPICGRCHPRPT